MKVFSILVALSVLDLGWSQTNYCAPTFCSGKKHIACNNTGEFASVCASDAEVMPIPNTLQNDILQKHNTLRNTVASGGLSRFQPAAHMATMIWDAELASLAVLNAKQCAMVHDACRATPQFPYAGQNLAVTSWWATGKKTVESIAMQHIQLWFDEHPDATMSQITKYTKSGKKVGHFIQMSVERANHVGCGIVRQTKDGFKHQFMACNYAFITFVNKSVYTAAPKAASKCETGTNPSFQALCSVNEVYNVLKP